MARIFITGSTDGLGQLTAKALIDLGHEVVLHARNAERAKQARQKTPGATDMLIADLESIDETKFLAESANASGIFDVVFHNAGVYRIASGRKGPDGFPVIFTVNTLAPYLLTCLIKKPRRLIYLSSGMHRQGDVNLNRLFANLNNVTYSDTKLHDVILSMAVARKWKDVYSNAVNPGWVPTKMGGAGAPDSLEKGFQTQVWLAVSDEPEAKQSGQYFHHKKKANYFQAVNEPAVQDKLLQLCEEMTGVRFSDEQVGAHISNDDKINDGRVGREI